MSSTYRLLTPRLLDEDLARAGLKTETTLALQTLRTLLDRPDGVDEGVVRGQIDAALSDPAMDSSLLHTLFRSNDAQDAHVLFGALDTLERQIVARQQASRQDVHTMLQFARTILLSPMQGDRPQLRTHLIQEMLTALATSDIAPTDPLTQALERLTLACRHAPRPSSPHNNASTASVGPPPPAPTLLTAGVSLSPNTSHIAIQGQLVSAGDPGDAAGTISPSPPPPLPVASPSPVSMPSSPASLGVTTTPPQSQQQQPQMGGTVLSSPTVQAGADGGGGNNAEVQGGLESPPAEHSPQTLAMLEAIGGGSHSSSPSPLLSNGTGDGLEWLNTQLTVSPPTSASNSPTSMMALPTVMRLQVVLLRDARERDLAVVASRCGLTADALAQFWYGHYPFDITPPVHLATYPCCVQVPDGVTVTEGAGMAFELRVVSKHAPELPEWDDAMHRVAMALCALVLDERRSPPWPASMVTPGTHQAPTATLSSAPASTTSRANLRAPGPIPTTLAPEMQCLQHVMNGLDVSRVVRDQVPLLRARHVHNRQVLEWCVIIKPLDANGCFRVFRLNNKPNNRYASATPSDLHIPPGTTVPYLPGYVAHSHPPPYAAGAAGAVAAAGAAVGAGATTDDTFPYTHALPMLAEAELCSDDGRLSATTFVVHPLTRPTPLYTTNMFGGYLVCGWYTDHTTPSGTTTRFYVFRAEPRTMYVYRDVATAFV